MPQPDAPTTGGRLRTSVGIVLAQLRSGKAPGASPTNGPRAEEGEAAPEPGGVVSIVKLGVVRVEWIDNRSHAVQELERLKQILQDEYQNVPEEQAALGAAMQTLTAKAAALDEELGDQLDRVLNADPAQRPKQVATANGVLARFENFLATDELMAAMDGNEYDPGMVFVEPLRDKLRDIAAALG